jgi:hypothetical protein
MHVPFLRPVERRRRRALERSGVGGHARLGVGAVEFSTAVRHDRRAARGLLRGAEAVSRTAAAAAAALVHSAARRTLPGQEAREADAAAAERQRTAQPVDIDAPVVSERWITGVEIVIVAFEWTFWFATWSTTIDRGVPWYGAERIAAALLALVTPLLGVYGARLGGCLTHRVLRDLPGVGRIERVGAIAGLALATLSMVAIAWLAHWRFTDGAGISAVHVPAVAMALVFALVVVLDVLLRIFGASEADRRRREGVRAVRRGRRRAVRADVTVLRADARARTAWNALRARIEDVLLAVELAGVTGDLLVLDAVVAAGVDGPEAAPVAPRRAAGVAVRDGYRLPSPERQLVLAGDHHVPFLLRHVEDAIDALTAHPTAGTGTTHEVVGDLRRRLAAVGPEAGRPAAEPRLRAVPRIPQPRTAQPRTIQPRTTQPRMPQPIGRAALRVAGR